MKTLLLTFLILFSFAQQSLAQDNNDDLAAYAKKMGIVAYLTQIKYTTEFQMSQLVNNSQYEIQTEKAKEFNEIYNLLKINVDLLINQFSADLYQNNHLKLYKEVNRYVKEEKELSSKYRSYQDGLKRIEALANTLLIKDYSSKNGFSLSNILSIGDFVLDVVKLEQENRQNKVDNLIEILSQLRLRNLAELKESKKELK